MARVLRWLGGMLLVAWLGAGCTFWLPESAGWPSPTPAAPGQPVEVAAPSRPEPAAMPALPPQLAAGAVMTLAELVDLALSRNPDTRIAYLAARAAAADLALARSAYLPDLELDGSLSRARQAALGGRTVIDQTTYGPTLTLSYLLFDFGGRGGRIDAAREALVAAAASHNAATQAVALAVEEAYYDVLAVDAAVAAGAATLKQTEQALAAAESRRESGVATIAEVLQARTAHSQARLTSQQLSGRQQGVRGVLATVLGLPAPTPIVVGSLPEGLTVAATAERVDAFIARALAARPDLAAARAQALRAEAQVSVARAAAFPSLHAVGAANRQYYVPHPAAAYSDNWSAQLLLRVPLFDGFAAIFAARRARADAEAALVRVESLEQQVILQVWVSFHAMEAAAQSLNAARDLLASAEQSERVAMGRYQEGAGSLLELLTAQSAMAGARAAEIGARVDWLRAVARLAHSTATLGPSDDSPRKGDE